MESPLSIEVSLVPGSARIVTFPFTASEAFLNELAGRNPEFAASTLEFRARVTQEGHPVEGLVPDGHLPCAFREAGDFPEAKVEVGQGGSSFRIRGEELTGPFAYVGWNWGTGHHTIRDFGDSGMHVYRVVFQPWSLWKNGRLDPEEFERKTTEIIASIVGRDPKAVIYLFWWLWVPKTWGQSNPDDVILYDDGTPNTPHPSPDQKGWQHASTSSELWRKEQTEILATAVRRLRQSPYADRIFSISTGYGNGGEWNGWGYHGGRFSDYSPAGRRAFQQWCRSHYGSIGLLNEAWGTSYKKWEELSLPSAKDRLVRGWESFAGPETPPSVIDYHRFQSDETADLITYFGGVVKEASGGRLLVGAYYGYFASHLVWSPYHSLDSGHYALERVLKSPNVDFIQSPYSYGDRLKNIGLGNPVASVLGAGKGYLVELDLATHLDGVNAAASMAHHGRLNNSAEETLLLYWRDFARVSSWGLNAHWYDFNKGWYRFPEFKVFLEEVGKVRREINRRKPKNIARVAVLLDEKSALLTGAHSNAYGASLYDTLVYELDAAGAPWDAWLASDLDKVLQRGYDLVIFLNQFADIREVERQFEEHPVNVLWAYGAGVAEGGQWHLSPQAGKVSMEIEPGRAVGPISFASLTLPAPTTHRTWAGVKRTRVEEVKPRIVISEQEGLQITGRFPDGQGAIAERANAKQRSFWAMTPRLSSELLGKVYDEIGIHRYTRDGSNAYVNSAIAAVWNARGGDTEIFLPKKAARVIDARSGRIVGEETDRISVQGRPDAPTFGFFLYE